MVEYADNLSPYPHYKGGIPIDFVLASIQVTSFIQKKKKY
jgi:gamma-tubulin complex component 6